MSIVLYQLFLADIGGYRGDQVFPAVAGRPVKA
jgi:hypothetical protein